ncbi:SU10 major capsid protein [Micromonospora echinospora]|uniref:SU10 major capsid protein n=1 Tax=Micromonospora echinospora TaxID=1877 RepID=UPI003A852C6B
MAGITALGTTYNLPNYTGILHLLTPADTPFFSAIGGLTGGGQTTDTEFEWGTYDLRAAGQNVALEGQDAPADQVRVRGTAKNVTQIHQETVGVSYTKQAATGRLGGLATAGGTNSVLNELDWQTETMLKQVVRDVEWSFINGTYQLPADNTTPRKTRGLLAAIATNAIDGSVAVPNGTGATATAATDLITANGHGLANNDQVNFTSVGTAAPLVVNTVYYVVNSTTNTFSVSATRGGAAVNITADGTVTFRKRQTLTKVLVDDLLQLAYDNGGIMESETATLLVGSSQRRAVTTAYVGAGGYVTKELSGNVGGVTVDRIQTDFGTLNVMLDRHMPADALAVVSLEQCRPVYLEVPGKGHFFEEPLAKTGAKDRNQIYGEVGLAYGNERTHAKYTALAV